MKAQCALIAASLIFLSASLTRTSWCGTLGSKPGATYDAQTEQTVEGVIETIEGQPSPLMLAGAHLTLLTATGKLDVHLGPVEPRNDRTYGLRIGDRVEVTGSVIRFNGQPVLLARTVKHGDQVLTLRNRLGIPVASGASNGRAWLVRPR